MKKMSPNNLACNRKALRGLALAVLSISMGMIIESATVVSAFLPQTQTSLQNMGTKETDLFMARGFGSPTQSSSKKKKGKTKKKGGLSQSPEKTKLQWANKLKRVYGGTSAEEIAAGTEKRIGIMMKESLDEPIRKALELREAVQAFERQIVGMDAEALRERFTKDEPT